MKQEPIKEIGHGWKTGTPPYDVDYLCSIHEEQECGNTWKYQRVLNFSYMNWQTENDRQVVVAWKELGPTPEDIVWKEVDPYDIPVGIFDDKFEFYWRHSGRDFPPFTIKKLESITTFVTTLINSTEREESVLFYREL